MRLTSLCVCVCLRFFFHIGVEYLFTFWACFMLYREYNTVALMRLQYLASQRRRPEQFTVSESFNFFNTDK